MGLCFDTSAIFDKDYYLVEVDDEISQVVWCNTYDSWDIDVITTNNSSKDESHVRQVNWFGVVH